MSKRKKNDKKVKEIIKRAKKLSHLSEDELLIKIGKIDKKNKIN